MILRFVLTLFFTINLFAEVNFTNPTQVTGDSIPNLSKDGQVAIDPQIATDATGKYAYAIWSRNDGTDFIIQVAISADHGQIWVNPASMPPTGSAPNNLSQSGEQALNPQIVTDATGQYVYAIWARYDGTNYIIQVARSTDYGQNWVNPASLPPTGSAPNNLSQSGQSAQRPQIATDATGQYVYAIWARSDGTNTIIQVARSTDYGQNWVDPTGVPSGGLLPNNLSQNGRSADFPQIATDATGQYVYAIWTRGDGFFAILQVAISSDSGDHWSDPTSVPPTGSAPNNLSPSFADNARDAQIIAAGPYVYVIWTQGGSGGIRLSYSADHGSNWINPVSVPSTGSLPNKLGSGSSPQITTDATGKYVYAIWNTGSSNIIQVALSSDSGQNWISPTSVTGDAIPDLSLSQDGEASHSQITTDATGQFVYALWQIRKDAASNGVIQFVFSSDFGDSWNNPTRVPSTGSLPNNLSEGGATGYSDVEMNPQIATDANGQYIYAIWQRYFDSSAIYMIQIAIASPFHSYYPISIKPKHL